jgi:uncharacterized peroxidase-related enzyme
MRSQMRETRKRKDRVMSRLHTPTLETAPAAAQPMLHAVRRHLGIAPNLVRIIANSPAALQGYLALDGALANGELDRSTRERIALAVSEVNGCDYCLSAHTYLGKNVAHLDEAEIARNRDGASADPKADAALRFAVRVVRDRGHVTDADLAALKAAGYGDGAAIEVVVNVALSMLTNFVNNVADTEIDFPVVARRQAA